MENIEQLNEVLNKIKDQPTETESYLCLGMTDKTSIGLLQGRQSEICAMICHAMDSDANIKEVIYRAVMTYITLSDN